VKFSQLPFTAPRPKDFFVGIPVEWTTKTGSPKSCARVVPLMEQARVGPEKF
jgi:hypothetical protein